MEWGQKYKFFTFHQMIANITSENYWKIKYANEGTYAVSQCGLRIFFSTSLFVLFLGKFESLCFISG